MTEGNRKHSHLVILQLLLWFIWTFDRKAIRGNCNKWRAAITTINVRYGSDQVDGCSIKTAAWTGFTIRGQKWNRLENENFFFGTIFFVILSSSDHLHLHHHCDVRWSIRSNCGLHLGAFRLLFRSLKWTGMVIARNYFFTSSPLTRQLHNYINT